MPIASDQPAVNRRAIGVYRKNVPAVMLSGSSATYGYTTGQGAGQFIAGLAISAAAALGLDLTLDYRLMEIAGSGDCTVTATAGVLHQSRAFKNRSQTDQSILLGVRYYFGG